MPYVKTDITFKVEIELLLTSHKIMIDAINTYEKGSLFCVYDGKFVHKFPVDHIFRIKEEYSGSVTTHEV